MLSLKVPPENNNTTKLKHISLVPTNVSKYFFPATLLLQNYFLLLHPMKEFTEQQAIDTIFNGRPLTPAERVHKSRYIKGTLSKKVIEQILVANGFDCIQEKLYIKK